MCYAPRSKLEPSSGSGIYSNFPNGMVVIIWILSLCPPHKVFEDLAGGWWGPRRQHQRVAHGYPSTPGWYSNTNLHQKSPSSFRNLLPFFLAEWLPFWRFWQSGKSDRKNADWRCFADLYIPLYNIVMICIYIYIKYPSHNIRTVAYKFSFLLVKPLTFGKNLGMRVQLSPLERLGRSWRRSAQTTPRGSCSPERSRRGGFLVLPSC